MYRGSRALDRFEHRAQRRNTMLWGALPYRAEERLAVIWSVPPQHPESVEAVSIPDFLAFQERNRSFEALGAVGSIAHDFGPAGNGIPAERILGEEYRPELLQALGVEPLMGRLFTAEEDPIDHPAPVLVVSYRLWQRRFRGDTNILGRTVLVDGVPRSIIGVIRPGFLFSDDHAEYLEPMTISSATKGSGRFLVVCGRLKPGVSIAQAQADIDPIARQLAREYPRDMEQGKPWLRRVQPVREAPFGFMRRPLLLLQGARWRSCC